MSYKPPILIGGNWPKTVQVLRLRVQEGARRKATVVDDLDDRQRPEVDRRVGVKQVAQVKHGADPDRNQGNADHPAVQ